VDTARPDRPTRRRTILLLLTVALLNVPAVAVATHLFTDVADGSTHAAGIHYLAEGGITAGCTPTTYCPTDGLTRAQMGTFLHRASGNAPGTDASVNAATVTAGAVQTVQASNTVANAGVNTASVECPAGTVVVGGGGFSSSSEFRLEDSRPVGPYNWQVRYRHESGTGNQTTTVYARCLAVGP
jgi:hypothetical protein